MKSISAEKHQWSGIWRKSKKWSKSWEKPTHLIIREEMTAIYERESPRRAISRHSINRYFTHTLHTLDGKINLATWKKIFTHHFTHNRAYRQSKENDNRLEAQILTWRNIEGNRNYNDVKISAIFEEERKFIKIFLIHRLKSIKAQNILISKWKYLPEKNNQQIGHRISA